VLRSFPCKYSCTLLERTRRTGRALLGVAVSCALLVAAFSGAAAGTAIAARSSCGAADLRPSAGDAARVASATLCLVDRLRAAHHLRPLQANRALGKVAASQVATMIRKDYFADVRPSGQTPMSLVAATSYKSHASAISVAETLAWGTGPDATAARIVAQWMASPPHRELILAGEFRDAGVAVMPAVPSVVARGKHGATYAIELGARWF